MHCQNALQAFTSHRVTSLACAAAFLSQTTYARQHQVATWAPLGATSCLQAMLSYAILGHLTEAFKAERSLCNEFVWCRLPLKTGPYSYPNQACIGLGLPTAPQTFVDRQQYKCAGQAYPGLLNIGNTLVWECFFNLLDKLRLRPLPLKSRHTLTAAVLVQCSFPWGKRAGCADAC